jgi:hypothetical protein
MANKELFVPRGILDVSKGWQEVVNQASSHEEMQKAAGEACRELERMNGFSGSRNIYVKSRRAIMVRDELEPEPDEEVEGVEFRNVTLAGWLGRISYIEFIGRGSIAWPVYDALVLEHKQEAKPRASEGLPLEGWYQDSTDRMRKPLYLPVDFIDVALAAA